MPPELSKEELLRQIQRILHEDDTARDIRAGVHAAFGDYIKRALPWYKTVVVLALLFGLTATGIATYIATYFTEQRARVQESVRLISFLPEVLLQTAGAVQDFRRQQAALVQTNLKRWELQDRIEELEVLEAGMGRRLTRLLDLHIAGKISRTALDLQTKATLAFAKALGSISMVAEVNDDNYKKLATPLLQRAIIADGETQFSTVLSALFTQNKGSYAEPLIKYASLLNTQFSDLQQASKSEAGRCCLNLLREAQEKLKQARQIIESDRQEFYGANRYGEFLLAEFEYQSARSDYYLAPFCEGKRLECGEKDPEVYWSRALESLEGAQAHYQNWRHADGTATPDVNPRYTALSAIIYYWKKDLIKAEERSKRAIEQAQQRGTQYWDPLNTLAWVYSEGFIKNEKFLLKRDLLYYSRVRSEAIDAAHRGLLLLSEGTEQWVEGLLTLAATLRNFSLGYHVVVVEYKALSTLRRLIDSSKDSQDADRLRTKFEEVCGRVVDDVLGALLAFSDNSKDVYQRRFYEGRLNQILSISRGPNYVCPEKTGVSARTERDALIRAGRSFSAAVQEAASRNGLTLRAELGLTLADYLMAVRFPKLVPEERQRQEQLRPRRDSRMSGQVQMTTSPINTLERLEVDPGFLRDHFLAVPSLRVAVQNNLVLSTLLTEQGYPGFSGRADEVVLLALEAAIESRWQEPEVLYALAAALLKRAIGDRENGISEPESFEKGLSLIDDLSRRLSLVGDLSRQSTKTQLRKAVEKLKACFDRSNTIKGRNCRMTEALSSED